MLKDGDGNPMAGQTINFTMTNSHPVYPASLNPLTAVTDAAGVARSTLTSSRKIGATATVKATYGDKSAETAAVTMRAAVGKRRYGIKAFNQGFNTDTPDDGWDFDFHLLSVRDEAVQGFFFLKFQKNEGQPDMNYFEDEAGNPVPSVDTDFDDSVGWISEEEHNRYAVRDALTDADNWLSVNGHDLEISITEIVTDSGDIIQPNSDYVYLADNAGNPISIGLVTTPTNGSGQVFFRLRAGPLIHQCSEIRLSVVDTTQVGP